MASSSNNINSHDEDDNHNNVDGNSSNITATAAAATTTITATTGRLPPVRDVLLGRSIVSNNNNNNRHHDVVIADTDRYRAVHRIRLSALAHNYAEIESAANRQRCSVIVVVKADGYGHGAIPTALFLADVAGADSFAVATLEEAIALRRAFQRTAQQVAAGSAINLNRLNNDHNIYSSNIGKTNGSTTGGTVAPVGDDLSTTTAAWTTVGGGNNCCTISNSNGRTMGGGNSSRQQQQQRRRSLRPAHIRILVLGPPVGFPRCFDDYYHHNIEVMISGPEVARALLEWVYNKDERKRTLVERVANESKERILSTELLLKPPHGQAKPKRTDDVLQLQQQPHQEQKQQQQQDSSKQHQQQRGEDWSDAISLSSSRSGNTPPAPQQHKQPQYHPPSATLGNVTGMDLAKEVREILKNQKILAESQQLLKQQQMIPAPLQKTSLGGSGTHSRKASGSLPPISALTFTPVSSNQDLTIKLDPTNDNATASTNTTSCDPSMTLSATTTAATTTTKSSSSSSNSSPAITPTTVIPTGHIQVFAGIEEAAKYSRTRQKVISSGSGSRTDQVVVFRDPGDDDCDDDNDGHGNDHDDDPNGVVVEDDVDNYNDEFLANSCDTSPCGGGTFYTSCQSTDAGDIPVLDLSPLVVDPTTTTTTKDRDIRRTYDQPSGATKSRTGNKGIPVIVNPSGTPLMVVPTRKRLRWHAEVESGMGRSGFQTDPLTKDEEGLGQTTGRDPVDIIKELVDLEVKTDCPIEFYGMCTHMADAHSNSTYTHEQIDKFKSLLRRVRGEGISVPTISTDNSAALLTPNLTHFDPRELLTQAATTGANSRGYVRTGGGIYGQRPSFTQLQAVSTLMASVRHVAVLKKGESVGYDRAYVAPTNVRIATIAIGFADGYPRELGNGVGKVSIRGHIFPTAGNVCMDMLMVELGSAEHIGNGDSTIENDNAMGAQVVVGDTAILWGPDPDGGDDEDGGGHVRLQDIASILKTTQSALTCGLNKERVLRQYA